MKSLIGKYIRGFSFKTTDGIEYGTEMDMYINHVGKVIDEETNYVQLYFKDCDTFWYPKKQALKHLLTPQEVSLHLNQEFIDNSAEETLDEVMNPIDELEIEDRVELIEVENNETKTIISEEEIALAKELFVKNYNPNMYHTVDASNAIAAARRFYNTLNTITNGK